MSGGSFDYISTADLARVLDQQDQVKAMADELDALGFITLASATRAWFTESGEHMRAMQERLAILQDAWHGVEWWRSGDRSEHDARLACRSASDKLMQVQL